MFPDPTASLTPDRWNEIHRALTEADERLLTALHDLWKERTDAIAEQHALIEHVSTTVAEGAADGPPTPGAARKRLDATVTHGIAPMLDALNVARPGDRVLAAFETWDREVSQWLRAVPVQANLSGPDATALARATNTKLGWRTLAGLDPRRRPQELRRLISVAHHAAAESRTMRDGLILQAFARALRDLHVQWEVAYRRLSSADHIARETFEKETRAAAGELLTQGIERIERRQRWREDELIPASVRRLAAAVAGIGQQPAERTIDRTAFLAHWARQFRTVQDEMRLARAAVELEGDVATLLQGALDAAFEERQRLADDLAAARTALDGPDAGDLMLQVPPAQHPAPTQARMREIGTGLRALLLELPEAVELPDELPPLPGSGGARRVSPRREVLEAFEEDVVPELQALFEELEEEHRDVVRDLERARAVVAFSLASVGATRNEAQERIADEARQNARRLLEHRRESLGDRRPQLETRLTGFARRVLEPLHEATSPDGRALALRRRRARLRAQSGTIGAQVLDTMGRGVTVVTRHGAALLDRALIRIGWRAEPVRERSEVVRRPTLPPALSGDDTGHTISELYAHLFRQDPVEDPRFLIGREPELQAIAEARDRWEKGHAAAVLVVGERGSGKTSLLNCAVLGPLAGLSLVRTEFRERLTTPDALRTFLRAAVGAPEGTTLENFLAQDRRVIVLEEIERAFLRQVGQYDAVRELQRVITATSRTTLWVLVVNGIAFRLLDPAVRFGEVFSHRIDASSATAAELQAAILFRHNLSGLRVRYEETPVEGAMARARAALRRQDAEQVFFASLAARSDRVYRTAFSLWLRHIEPEADGAITVRRIADVGADAVVAGLGHVHLFTLLATLQHGSLTPEEHAAVFALPLDESRSQLNDLLARELLGPEAGRPGHRVRAEALPIVRQALYRRNLL